MPRADTILRHHRFSKSVGYPLTRIQGTVTHIFNSPENHHGANHQQFRVSVDKVLLFQGGDTDITGEEVFIAVRFGDTEGLDSEVRDLAVGQPIEIQGEYIDAAEAYRTQDNSNPTLPVIHFTHHPVGYILYQGQNYS